MQYILARCQSQPYGSHLYCFIAMGKKAATAAAAAAAAVDR